MLKHFNTQWDTIPTNSLDTETTGLRVGYDKAVSVAIVRFENGLPVASMSTLVDPGMPIPESATAIHGITDVMVKGAPKIEDWFQEPEVIRILDDAQPSAFNGSYDRYFVPPFGTDWTWPWLDGLTFVRLLDRYAPGKGRHRLEPTCARHGIKLKAAHSAEADALAAGELLLKLGRKMFPSKYTLGQALGWQRRQEAVEWMRHMSWRSGLPEIEVDKGNG